MLVRLAASSVIMVLTIAAPAQAARFTGETNQGARVSMKTNGSDIPTAIRVSRYRADCRDSDVSYPGNASGYRAPFDRASAEAVRDRGLVRGTREGYRVRIAASLDLRRREDGSWRAKDVRRVQLKPESDGDTLRCRATLTYTLRA